jgi:fatty acyl-CoA reductase
LLRPWAPTIIYRVVENPGTPGSGGPPPASSDLRSALAGRHVLVTGATGFLGTALLERLLAEFPATLVTVLVRGRYGSPPVARVQELLAGNCFRSLRERLSPDGIQRLIADRITILEGDVSEDVPSPPDVDVVFHCAATVAFDPPIDQAFKINLLGATRLYEAVLSAGARPHLVHVSTAYVAGMTKGVVPEATLDHRVDWRAELDAAMSARRQVEDASRKPEMLDRFMDKARSEHRRAGPIAVATAAEEHRGQWVEKRLVQYGRARAQAMGWPDVYTFTKALGERATEELAAANGAPLSIVRPSIIESALAHPYPGWIEGFKMAEPIILAYGRGAIPEFPGLPEGVVDIIPIDLVVNAMLATHSPNEDAERFGCPSGASPAAARWSASSAWARSCSTRPIERCPGCPDPIGFGRW